MLGFLTDLADQAVLLPLIASLALLLFLGAHWGVLAAWLVATSAVLGLTVLLKLGFYGASLLTPALASIGLVSPSGHVAAGTVTYGGIAFLLGPDRWRRGSGQRWSWLAGLGVALTVGLTRVATRDHSIAEVMVGAAIGIMGLHLFTTLAAGGRRSPSRGMLVGVTLATIALFHGDHLAIEKSIRGASAEVVSALRAYSPGPTTARPQ